MLFGIDLVQPERFALSNIIGHAARFLLFIFVLALAIEQRKTGKFDDIASGPHQVGPRFDIDRGNGHYLRFHLRSDKAPLDEFIDLRLVLRQQIPELLRI